ncbi:hypothetical protein C8D90_101247 [Enterobacillus tribolii]|uniref:Uncharacterized protein n=1 Tax=Enterobacillus tribolii TaxID=1487935 RepID=A0A370R311_9GAMM|nr:hypothetical protein C8D90_101247 [Enterobacillus tribolii]
MHNRRKDGGVLLFFLREEANVVVCNQREVYANNVTLIVLVE